MAATENVGGKLNINNSMNKFLVIILLSIIACRELPQKKGTMTGKLQRIELGEDNTFFFIDIHGDKPYKSDTIQIKDWELPSCKDEVARIYENENQFIGKTFKIDWIEAIDSGEAMEFKKGYKHYVLEYIKLVK